MGRRKVVPPPVPIDKLLYISGHFTNGFAVLDKETKQLVSGYPTFNRYVYRCTYDANNLYLGGYFSGYFAVINRKTKQLVSGYPTDWNNNIWAVEVDNDNIYVGGFFYQAGNDQYFSVINKTTKERVIGYPLLNSMLYTIKTSGEDIYVAGAMSAMYINGVGIMEKDTKDWASQQLSPQVGSWAAALDFDGSNIYIGGKFADKFKVYDKTTRTQISGYPTFANGFVHAITHDANNIYIGGDFTNKFAVINKSTKQLVSGYPSDWDGYISGIQVDANNIYVGGFFNGGFAVINKSTKQLVSGYPTFDNPVITLEQSN